jgi:hypothetical protein
MAIVQKTSQVKPVTVTLPSDVIHKVKVVARAEDRSFSNALAQLVRRATGQVENKQELVTT